MRGNASEHVEEPAPKDTSRWQWELQQVKRSLDRMIPDPELRACHWIIEASKRDPRQLPLEAVMQVYERGLSWNYPDLFLLSGERFHFDEERHGSLTALYRPRDAPRVEGFELTEVIQLQAALERLVNECPLTVRDHIHWHRVVGLDWLAHLFRFAWLGLHPLLTITTKRIGSAARVIDERRKRPRSSQPAETHDPLWVQFGAEFIFYLDPPIRLATSYAIDTLLALAGHALPSPNLQGIATAPTSPKKRGGRKPLPPNVVKKRQQLIAEYQRAKETGESLKGFSQDRKVDPRELRRALAWAAQRRRRAAGA